VIDNSVYIASGGLLVNGSNTFRQDGVFIRDLEDNWSVFNKETFPQLATEQADLDFYRVIGHPSNDKIYFGTYYGGLIEVEGESITVYPLLYRYCPMKGYGTASKSLLPILDSLR